MIPRHTPYWKAISNIAEICRRLGNLASGVRLSAGKARRHESIMESSAHDKRATGWCLESTADGGRSLERVQIQNIPFRIGRLDELELTLSSQSISKHHAEITLDDDGLKLRDLGSTNGTFVNRRRIEDAITLQEGDILHFAEIEFRVGRTASESFDDGGRESGTLSLARLELPQHFVGGTREMTELLEEELVSIVFQSVVSLPGGDIMAYECLGRGTHGDLPRNPKGLFRVAETMDRETELSRLFRKKAALAAASAEGELPTLFLNSHPNEIGTPELVESLREAREILPNGALALEIHEGALAEPQVIAQLKKELNELEIHLALDDFGLGERFLLLAEVPPDYLKFDISVVKDLVSASSSKRRLVSMLMAAAREVGAQPIAEGIESEKEAGVCTMMGFTLAQGYLYGEPVPLSAIVELGSDTIEQRAPEILKKRD